MSDRYTKVLLGIIAVASTVLLTSCSNPDTSGGVTMQKADVGDGHPGHWPFPHGSCSDQHDYSATNTGCGWITANNKSYYIKPHSRYLSANLTNANLAGANLSRSILKNANLTNANLINAILNNNILRNANLTNANLINANLTSVILVDANLSGANLTNATIDSSAILSGVRADSSTICPNGINWGASGNNCGFTPSREPGPGGGGIGVYCPRGGIRVPGKWCSGAFMEYGWPVSPDCTAANLNGEMCGGLKCPPQKAKIRRYICEHGMSGNVWNAVTTHCDEAPWQGGQKDVCWIFSTR